MATTKDKTKSRAADAVGLNDLLPCPFCGEKPKLEVHNRDYYGMRFMIICKNVSCKMLVTTGWVANKELAIKLWNTRVR